MTPDLHQHLENILDEHQVSGKASRLAYALVEIIETEHGAPAAQSIIDRYANGHKPNTPIATATALWAFLVSIQIPCPIPLDEK